MPAMKAFEISMKKDKEAIEVVIDPQDKVIKKTDAKEEKDEEKEDGK